MQTSAGAVACPYIRKTSILSHKFFERLYAFEHIFTQWNRDAMT